MNKKQRTKTIQHYNILIKQATNKDDLDLIGYQVAYAPLKDGEYAELRRNINRKYRELAQVMARRAQLIKDMATI